MLRCNLTLPTILTFLFIFVLNKLRCVVQKNIFKSLPYHWSVWFGYFCNKVRALKLEILIIMFPTKFRVEERLFQVHNLSILQNFQKPMHFSKERYCSSLNSLLSRLISLLSWLISVLSRFADLLNRLVDQVGRLVSLLSRMIFLLSRLSIYSAD